MAASKKPTKPELDYWGNPVSAADKKRFAAEAAQAQKPKPAAPPKTISAEAKRRAESKQSINAASQKGLKGRRGKIDNLIDKF
jgi:hypothetical protein